jgi:eukaryotic-like serine/threonine-protein kinase
MPLVSGTRIGSYEITGAIGAGGMGEVYRARDAKLGRDVAVKVLPTSFARDPDRMARFEREAKLLASLDHTNIASIYGLEESDGTRALVMQLAEGPTLADRIAAGPIPVDESLRIARQIADALEYAHERGVVHRDLKPANIKISRDDSVKILDFGLAKAVQGEASEVDAAKSPTLTHMATQAGILLGTAAYMSPEQAKAKPVDRRADIWAFGCVLYEMLTGKHAFPGETVTDTLAAVIKEDPDWSQLPKDTPVRVRVLLQRCLQKDPKQRLRDIGDARISLDEVLAGTTEPIAGATAPSSPRRRLIFAIAGTAGLIIVGIAAYLLGRNAATTALPAMHFSAVTNFSGVQGDPSLSPDGRSIAFISNRDGHFNIYVTLLHGGNLVEVTHDADLKRAPSWSPDGATLAYAQLNESGVWDIWEVPALGGTPRRVILNAADPTWSPDGHSLAYFSPADGAIWICGTSGENAHLAVRPWKPGGWDTQPRFSPDGRSAAFAARDSNGSPYGELAVADLDSGKTRILTHDNALALSPAWSSDGQFIYFASSRGGTFNIWKIAVSGGVPEQITAGEGDDADLDVSADGKRIVFGTLRQKVGLAQLDLQKEAGQQNIKILTADPARNQFGPAYSPDGKYLAYFTNLKGAEKEAIRLSNADGSNAEPLVEDGLQNVFPEWAPDGKFIVYLGTTLTKWEVRRVPIGGGAPALLTVIPVNSAEDVGPDGRILISKANGILGAFDSRDGKTRNLGILPVQPLWGKVLWSADQRSVAFMRNPSAADDQNAGLWIDDFKDPPRQIFRGWVIWFSRSEGNEIDLLQGEPNLDAILWKVNWDGQGLTRTPARIPGLYDANYFHTTLVNEFAASPDGRYLAFQTDQVLEENISMIENIR